MEKKNDKNFYELFIRQIISSYESINLLLSVSLVQLFKKCSEENKFYFIYLQSHFIKMIFLSYFLSFPCV